MSVVTALRQKCGAAFAAVDFRCPPGADLETGRARESFVSRVGADLAQERRQRTAISASHLTKFSRVMDLKCFSKPKSQNEVPCARPCENRPGQDPDSHSKARTLHCGVCRSTFNLSVEDQDAFCCGRPASATSIIRTQPQAIEPMRDRYTQLTHRNVVDQDWVVV